MLPWSILVILICAITPPYVENGNPFLPSDVELTSGLRELLYNPGQLIPPPQPWLPRLNCKWPFRFLVDDTWVTFDSPMSILETAVSKCSNRDHRGIVPGCELNLAARFFGNACEIQHVQAEATSRQCAIGQNFSWEAPACIQNSRMPQVNPWAMRELFSEPTLIGLARSLHDQFQSAAPFPNVVLDNFVPWQFFKEVDYEIPSLSPLIATMYCGVGWLWCMTDKDWHWLKWTLPMDLPVKPVEAHFGPATKLLADSLRSTSFLRFLEELTGIENLLPDPLLWGGGIHQTASKGYLGLHVDFPEHPVYNLFHRRVNVFMYLNGEWDDDFGGDLELWKKTPSGFRCIKKIRALPNRVAIFVMSPSSWHGHPWPLRAPLNSTRRSLAFYYYTVNSSVKWGTFRHGTSRSPTVPCKHWNDPKCYSGALVV